MIDFACKQFNLDDIIKCSLGLTKTELKILKLFLKPQTKNYTSENLSKNMNLNLTTIQKAVKKLSDKKIILKHQKNLQNGGYIFIYTCNSKSEIKRIIKTTIQNWSNKVEQKIDQL